MPFLPPNQQCQSTEGQYSIKLPRTDARLSTTTPQVCKFYLYMWRRHGIIVTSFWLQVLGQNFNRPLIICKTQTHTQSLIHTDTSLKATWPSSNSSRLQQEGIWHLAHPLRDDTDHQFSLIITTRWQNVKTEIRCEKYQYSARHHRYHLRFNGCFPR